MPCLVLTPGAVKRMSELKKSEMIQGFDREEILYTASRDGDHVKICIVDH